MKDEIKEISIKMPGQILDYVDTKEHLLDLFNYITNLQEENKRLKENKLTPDELANLLNQELIKQRDDYKSRNEKAIEYIKQHTEERVYKEPYNIDDFPNRVEYFIKGKWDLLNILQEEDNTSENLYKYTPENGFRLVGDDNE